MHRLLAIAVLVAALIHAMGCSGANEGGRITVHPVEGRILVLDRPAANARIAFHPLIPGSNAVCPVAVVRADGTFRLTTYVNDDGAPEGDYVVTVFWPDESISVDECGGLDFAVHDRLRGLYVDPGTSDLRATIRPGSNQIRLDATVGGRGWNLPMLVGTVGKTRRTQIAPATADEERRLLRGE